MADIVFIINIPPNRCPNCDHAFRWDNLARQDFYAKAAHTCVECGAAFQYVDSLHIVDTARQVGGDM